MAVQPPVVPDAYFICDPPNPLPGSLTVLLPPSEAKRFEDLVARKTYRRFIVRAILSDNIPLSGELPKLLERPSTSLLYVNDEPLTLHLEYPRYFPLMYTLHAGAKNELLHIDFLIDTNHPVAAFAPARTAVNQLLDVVMRHVWLPLVIVRLDLYLKDEPSALLHQLILPFTDRLSIGPLGGFGSFAPLAPYEALLREAIGAASDDEEENDMSRPMFMTVVQGRKVEFINISHVVRVEVVHPVEGQAGSGTVYLQDGTSRQLSEAEINFVMRTFQGLVGEPVAGTQDAAPGYWTGNKPEGQAKGE